MYAEDLTRSDGTAFFFDQRRTADWMEPCNEFLAVTKHDSNMQDLGSQDLKISVKSKILFLFRSP